MSKILVVAFGSTETASGAALAGALSLAFDVADVSSYASPAASLAKGLAESSQGYTHIVAVS